MSLDFWVFPNACIECNRQDNDDPADPTALLDVRTQLCEFCFSNLSEEEMDESIAWGEMNKPSNDSYARKLLKERTNKRKII